MPSLDEIVANEDVSRFTGLGSDRYRTARFGIRTAGLLDSFESLPLDPYCGAGRGALSKGLHRYRRYDDFRLTFGNGEWSAVKQPHRPFIQSPRFNKAVGGVARHLEPLLIDPSLELQDILTAFRFDQSTDIHVKLHQIRVVTSAKIHGVAVTEGPHRDGQEWQIVAVFRRRNIFGGESQLLPTGGGTPFFAKILDEGEAICNEDGVMWHNATDIIEADPGIGGYRDIWILATNRWSHRRYGEEFDTASMEHGQSDWSKDRPDESAQVTSLAVGSPTRSY